jgi:large subunit ribosomal protein L28
MCSPFFGPAPWLSAFDRGILNIRQAAGAVCLQPPHRRFSRPSGHLKRALEKRNELKTLVSTTGCGGSIFRIWSKVMAQVCDICGKGPQFGNNISHAHNVSRRRWNVNLQAVKALVNGNAKRIRVCTSCIKTGKVAKAPSLAKV